MPKWIHDRAMKLKGEMENTYSPKKAKQVAFAVATQQAHATGQAPEKFHGKVFGTPEGKREAKAKFDEPKSEYKKTAAGRGLGPGRGEGPGAAMGPGAGLRLGPGREFNPLGPRPKLTQKQLEELRRCQTAKQRSGESKSEYQKTADELDPVALIRKLAQEGAGQVVPAQPTTPTTAPAPSPQPPPPNSPNLAASTPGMKTTVASLRRMQKKLAQDALYDVPRSRNEERALEQVYQQQTGNPMPTPEELEVWRQQKEQAIQDLQQVPVNLGPVPPAPQQLLPIPSREQQEGQIQAVESPEMDPMMQAQLAPSAAMPAVGAAPAPASPGPATTASFVPPEAGAFQIR